MNCDAVDKALDAIIEINVPAAWKDAKDAEAAKKDVPEFIKI